jgi:hypothetical protein
MHAEVRPHRLTVLGVIQAVMFGWLGNQLYCIDEFFT